MCLLPLTHPGVLPQGMPGAVGSQQCGARGPSPSAQSCPGQGQDWWASVLFACFCCCGVLWGEPGWTRGEHANSTQKGPGTSPDMLHHAGLEPTTFLLWGRRWMKCAIKCAICLDVLAIRVVALSLSGKLGLDRTKEKGCLFSLYSSAHVWHLVLCPAPQKMRPCVTWDFLNLSASSISVGQHYTGVELACGVNDVYTIKCFSRHFHPKPKLRTWSKWGLVYFRNRYGDWASRRYWGSIPKMFRLGVGTQTTSLSCYPK